MGQNKRPNKIVENDASDVGYYLNLKINCKMN